jgi:hypothetical protein
MKIDQPISGSYATVYEGGEWLTAFHPIKTEGETYLWMKMGGISDEKFKETKRYEGLWVTIEFEGGELVADSPMDDATFNRIMMEQHRVKIGLSTDGSNDIHLYKYKGD